MKKVILAAAAVAMVALLGSCNLMGGDVIIEGATYSASNPDAVLFFETADSGILTEVDAYGNEGETEIEYTYDPAERSGRIDFPDGSAMKYAEFSISSNGEELSIPWPTSSGTTQEATLYLEE